MLQKLNQKSNLSYQQALGAINDYKEKYLCNKLVSDPPAMSKLESFPKVNDSDSDSDSGFVIQDDSLSKDFAGQGGSSDQNPSL